MIPLVFGTKVEYVRPDQLQRFHEWVDRWKVLLPMAGDGHGREVAYVTGEPIALAPGSACTQSYLVAGTFDTREETENYANYLTTTVRFLVLQRKATQHLTPERFRFVPQVDFTRPLDRRAALRPLRLDRRRARNISSPRSCRVRSTGPWTHRFHPATCPAAPSTSPAKTRTKTSRWATASTPTPSWARTLSHGSAHMVIS